MATLRSRLSWMRWRRRRRERELAEQNRRLQLMLDAQRGMLLRQVLQILDLVMERQLMHLAKPLAQAMQRQDDLIVTRTGQLSSLLRQQQTEQTDLLEAVLQSLQPTAEEQLLSELSTLPQSSPASTS